MAGINVGDIQAVFRVVDEASGPLNKIAGEVKASETSFGSLAAAAKGVGIAAAAAVAGATALGAAIIKIGEHGAGVGDITEQFGKLADAAGLEAAPALDALRTATAGTLSDLELMEQTLPLLQSGFRGNAQDLQTMASAARVLAEQGMSMSEALDAVSSAMTTGRTRTLQMHGVIVDVEGAMKQVTDAATAEGRAVSNSTAVHIKQTEILRGLRDMVERNGEVMLDFADRVDQAKVRFKNFYDEFARRLSESDVLNRFLDSAISVIGTALDEIGRAVLVMVDVLGAAFGTFQTTASGSMQDVATTIRRVLITAFKEIVTTFSFVMIEVNAARVVFGNLAQVLNLVTLGYYALALGAAEAMAKLRPNTANLAELQRIRSEMGKVVLAIDEQKAAFARAKDNQAYWADGAKKALADIDRAMADVRRSSEATTGAVTSGAGRSVRATNDFATALGQTKDAAKDAKDALDELFRADQYARAEQSAEDFLETQKRLDDEFARMSAELASAPEAWQVLYDAIDEVPPLLAKVDEAAEGVPPLLKKAGTEGGKSFSTGLLDIVKGIPDLMVSSLSGGGGLLGFFKSLGSQVGALFGNALGKILKTNIGGLLGDVVGAVLPGIGSLLGPLLGKVFGGKSEMAKADYAATEQIKKLQAELLRTYGSLQAIARAGGEAGAALVAAWGDRSQAGLAHFQDLLDQFTDSVADSRAELASLQQQLADRTVMDWERAQEVIERYGGTLDTLGGQFTAAKLAADWKSIWDDWETLIDMGADVGGTLSTMKDEIGALVAESLRIGTEIPEQFKPLIEELIRTGQLFDANGKAITDIGQLTFGAPLVSEVDKIIAAIDRLIAALTVDVPDAFEVASNIRIPPVKIPYEYEALNEPPSGGVGMPQYREGTDGQFVNFGAGTPVMLHGWEAVVPREQIGGSSPAAPATPGGGDQTITVPVILDSKVVTEVIIRRVANRLSVAGVKV